MNKGDTNYMNSHVRISERALVIVCAIFILPKLYIRILDILPDDFIHLAYNLYAL